MLSWVVGSDLINIKALGIKPATQKALDKYGWSSGIVSKWHMCRHNNFRHQLLSSVAGCLDTDDIPKPRVQFHSVRLILCGEGRSPECCLVFSFVVSQCSITKWRSLILRTIHGGISILGYFALFNLFLKAPHLLEADWVFWEYKLILWLG